MHLGSPIITIEPYRLGIEKGLVLIDKLRAQGHQISVWNMGGGFGINYRKNEALPAQAFADVIVPGLQKSGCKLVLEPGRFIVGNAGILVSRVIFTKESGGKRFIIQDAAMNDLIRPTLYEAHHDILPVVEAAKDARHIVADVVGPVCETGDYLALDRTLPVPKPGDLLAIMTAGAYGAVQSGTYNTRALVPEVLVNGDQYAVVRPRIEVDDLIAMDKPAPWL